MRAPTAELIRNVVSSCVTAAGSHLVSGPTRPNWTLRYAALVALMRASLRSWPLLLDPNTCSSPPATSVSTTDEDVETVNEDGSSGDISRSAQLDEEVTSSHGITIEQLLTPGTRAYNAFHHLRDLSSTGVPVLPRLVTIRKVRIPLKRWNLPGLLADIDADEADDYCEPVIQTKINHYSSNYSQLATFSPSPPASSHMPSSRASSRTTAAVTATTATNTTTTSSNLSSKAGRSLVAEWNIETKLVQRTMQALSKSASAKSPVMSPSDIPLGPHHIGSPVTPSTYQYDPIQVAGQQQQQQSNLIQNHLQSTFFGMFTRRRSSGNVASAITSPTTSAVQPGVPNSGSERIVPLPVTSITAASSPASIRAMTPASPLSSSASPTTTQSNTMSPMLGQRSRTQVPHQPQQQQQRQQQLDTSAPPVHEHQVTGPARYDGDERIILYFHGGAYILQSPASHRGICYRLSKHTGLRVLSVAYRLAPEHPFPAGLHDAVSVYHTLIDPDGPFRFKPENIIVGGDSAGGGLALALLLYLRDHNLASPAGGILMSPWVDLACPGESWTRNAELDYLLNPPRTALANPARLYVCPTAKSWDDNVQRLVELPYVSPAKTHTTRGLPPLIIQYGESEMLCDDVAALVDRIKTENRLTEHELSATKCDAEGFADMVHVFQMISFAKESKLAFQRIGEWSRNVVWPSTSS
ncbi:hypothetical protein GQ42DRAFT_164536 [Ramicandelaber brevisporus]|nr:hypothetical protein GQ42DRAFT_164536 [Ramicandelaber brevisporus]